MLMTLMFLAPTIGRGQSHPYYQSNYQSNFPPEEFRARWNKIFDKIGPGAIAIVQGAPQVGGFIYPRQTNEFYYLCGIETPHSYIILDGRTRRARRVVCRKATGLERKAPSECGAKR